MPLQAIRFRSASLSDLLSAVMLFTMAANSFAVEPASIKTAQGVTLQWKSLEIPKALVAVGVWGDMVKWREALHHQGIEYDDGYRYQNGYHRPAVQMVDIPTELADYRRYSTVVLINVDAPALGAARLAAIRQFVEQGGGLVVLGGYWAFERGAYADTPLAELLPVELQPRGDLPQDRAGAILTAGPASDWNWNQINFAAQPRTFYLHSLVAKPNAQVILQAGKHPAMIAGEFGQGRVVASALTVNGLSTSDALAFWDWADWPAVLGQTIEWAGANRPLNTQTTTAATTAPIDEEEAEKLRLEFQPLSKDVVARFTASPTAPAADAIFAILFPENKPKIELTDELVAALAAQAQAEWSETLERVADSLNPSLQQRSAALELLGATKSPAATKILLAALNDTDVATGAIAGLRRTNDAAPRPALIKLYEKHLASSDFRNYGEDSLGNTSAGVEGRIAIASAIALYHLGDPGGVERLVNLHREIRVLRRIFSNAAKRRVVETDPTGIALRAAIYKKAGDFSALEQQLLAAAGPVPVSQHQAFVTFAKSATQPEDVLWLAAALHRTPGNTDWSGLSQAKDGIVRRLATAEAQKQ